MSGEDTNPIDTLEKLHLKLVVANSDELLQRFTTDRLVQVIELAAANPSSVKTVTEILSFYNRRIKNNETSITFPVKNLLRLVGDGTYQTNLSSIYIKMALGKLSAEETIDLLPDILDRFAEKVGDISACNDIFLLTIPGLIALAKLAKEKWPKRLLLPLPVADRLSRYFLLLLLFENDSISTAELQKSLAQPDKASTFPGFCQEDCEYLQKKVLHSYPSLTEIKDAIVRLLDYDFFPEKLAFPLLVVASSSQLNSVTDSANLALKKVDIQECVDDSTVVEKLFDIYLGTAGKAEKNKNLPERQKIPHCSSAIKTKILSYLTRSRTAPTTFMANVRVCLDVENNLQNNKKTIALLQFILVVIEKMPESGLTAFSTSFFNKILKVIESGGIENAQCAALAYRCLGLLGKAKPSLVLDRMDLIEQLFGCIAGNAEDVSSAVMDCIVSWHSAFIRVEDSTILEKLKDIVKTHIVHENNRTRLTAIKYADALLRTGDMEIRWLLIQGAGDKRDDVRREGLRLLEASFRMPAPSLLTIVDYIWKEHNKNVIDAGQKTVKLSPEVLEMSTKFIWATCSIKSGDRSQMLFLEDDEHFFQMSPQVAEHLKQYPAETVDKITRMALNAATHSQDLFLLRIATCFALVHPIDDMPACSLACSQVARGSSRFEVLEAASRLSVLTEKENSKSLEKYLSDLETNPLPGTPWLAVSTAVFGQFEEAEKKVVYERLCRRLLVLIGNAYDHPSSMLESVCGALCLLLKNGFKIYQPDQKLTFELIEVCEKVVTSRKDAITLRARHAAVDAIGLFNSEADQLILEKMMTSLYAVGEGPPQSALQLAVGQALWNTAFGPYAAARREVYLEPEGSFQLIRMTGESEQFCVKNLSLIYQNILEEKLSSRNHHLRRAAIVWLLIFVQRSIVSANDVLSRKLAMIQTAFADGLTENDDFTQDIASKGMGLLYQNATNDQKKHLVVDLMNMLGSGRTSNIKVTDDTEVFKDNALGKAPDGSNLTTYKELCNLATDLNQPDLMYKFMQLAKHNATWNSKKGAAFGFGEILEQAKEDLEPYLPRLVPKLFRYRYDPDLKVQQSMRSIWSVLTSGRKNVMEKYADEIAKEIFPLLTDKEWRVRESSCLALSDLLHSNDTPFMHSKLPELYDTIMRVRDDIKESVRLAADKTADSMKKLIIRLGGTSNREKSETFLREMMPIVIEKGVNSTVKATVQFSLALLMEMSKQAGKQLQPFLHILIPCFLDAISENESAVLNYLAVRSSANQLEALDDLRTKYAGSSPMMTACNDLLPYINTAVLQATTPKICDQLRLSCGMSTRAAAAQLITQLTLRAPQLMIENKACCDKIFAALAPGVADRNPSVRKNSANALSYLAKFCSPGPIDKLMIQMNKNLVSENEDMKKASLHVLKNFSAHCQDIIQGHGAKILPYIFLETCREVIKGDDVSKKRHEEWSELWDELVSNTSFALKMYKKEIIAVAVDVLQNNTVWAVKAQAGRMLARVAESLGDDLTGADADSILTPLLPLLSGRIWDGKEKILMAIAFILRASGSQLVEIRGERMNEIAEILKREAGKKNKNYSVYGLTACAAFAEHTPSVEMAQWVQKRVELAVDKALKGEDSASEDESLSSLEKEALVAKFVSSNLVAFTSSLGAYRDGTKTEEAVILLTKFINNESLYWKARQDLLAELLELVGRWKLEKPVIADVLVHALLTAAEEMCDHQRKSIAAQALQTVMRMAERRNSFSMNWKEITSALQKSRAAQETGLSSRLDSALQMEMETD